VLVHEDKDHRYIQAADADKTYIFTAVINMGERAELHRGN
jgi:hypothetical protein